MPTAPHHLTAQRNENEGSSPRLTRRRLLTGAAVTLGAAGATATPTPSAAADPALPLGGGKGGGNGGGHGGGSLPTPSFTEVSVHDPSVIQVGSQTYLFGSHLAAARSSDLLDWNLVADLVTPENPLFDDVTEELSEAFEWAQSDTLWAADVQETTDGRFRMYYNACEGSSPRSAMGTAIAPTVEGPYEDEGIFLRSGMWDEPSEDGQIYDALIHPNVVDPHAFVDHRGKHRLVYGSYSGGIFLLDLDPKTGQPREGQGYGIHLIGGNHSRIEAPYMLYSRESGYYYLLVTFGGLDSFGGYNVRVGRSRSPVGPFLDKEGYDLRECTSDPDLPLFDDASIEPYGAKLMGGHQWTFGDEDPVGYTSPGHVSAWNDSERGGAFLVFHTRFPGQGELHQVRVHRLHVTKDGWPVLSPFRYGGEGPAGSRDTEVPRRALCGDWQVIDHGHDINVDPKQSQAIVLAANGRVSGALSGRWSSQGRHFVRLDLEGERFDGVVTRCWNPVTETWAPAISALGPDGRALWAVQE